MSTIHKASLAYVAILFMAPVVILSAGVFEMVVIATPEAVAHLENINIEILIYEDDKIEDAIIKFINKNIPIVAIYKNAWKRYPEVKKRIRQEGGNRFLYDPLDPIELDYACQECTSSIVLARHSALLASMSHKALFAPRTDKPLNRRALLKAPLKGLLDYYPAPILLQEEVCRSWKYCTNCVDSCPFDAISGKPPQVNLDRCVGCGICTGACPFGLLFMPQYNIEAFSYYLSILRKTFKEPAHLVIACRDSLDNITPPTEKVQDTFFLGVDCPGWITDLHIVLAKSMGFNIIFYCEEDNLQKCGGKEIYEKRFMKLKNLGIIINIIMDNKKLINILKQKINYNLVEFDIKSIVKNKLYIYNIIKNINNNNILEFNDPIVGFVNVDETKCLLCDACSLMCPTGALKLIKNNDNILLKFYHDKCISCGICEKICPYKAIKLEYKYDSKYINNPKLLANDEIARCRICGKPIGSIKHIKALEKKLRESGVDEWVIQQLWLCNECKLKALLNKNN